MTNLPEIQAQLDRDLKWANAHTGFCGEISAQPYLKALPGLLAYVSDLETAIAAQNDHIIDLEREGNKNSLYILKLETELQGAKQTIADLHAYIDSERAV